MDQSAKQDQAEKLAANINIDINGGDQDDGGVKSNMNLDSTTNDSRVGLSKEELMKYANQPFWVRLRNILFASFWIIWLSILVVAIGYVIHAPGCKLVSAQATSSANMTTAALESSTTAQSS